MNTYTVTFTTPIIRNERLKPRVVEVNANSVAEAETKVFNAHQGVQIVDCLCCMMVIGGL